VVSQVAVLAVLAAYATWGARFLRESAAGRIGSGMLLAMLGLGFLWFVQLPFGLVELWWQRRHGISEQDYVTWTVDTWFALGWEFLFICLAIVIVMGLAGPLPNWWWLPGGAVFVGLAALFAFTLPYLLPAQRSLRDPAIEATARRYEAELDLPRIPVRVQEMRTYTSAPNAEAAGIGPTRRVILWDTLLDGRFGDDEVNVVIAHELGHHAREHIAKGIGWYALFAFPGAFVIARATRRRGGMSRPEAVPLSLFVLVALSFAALPLQNVITRRMEAEADWIALETTEDPEAAGELFERFSVTGLEDPNPPGWSYLLTQTHPTIEQRIAMAEAWRRRAGR
jgi:STE24 endopeptidase